MEYEYIYLVFTRTGTLLSQLLSVFSETKYVHVSLSLDETFTKMYSFGRKDPYNPLSGGYVEENLYGGVYARFPKSECNIIKVKITKAQYHAIKKELELFSVDKEKYRYNFLGLFGILFNKPIKRNHHYFCTQFVSKILMQSGVYPNEKAPELMTTYDLLSINNQEPYYTGIISNSTPLERLYNFTLKL